MTSPAIAYRQNSAQGAEPVALVILLYDEVLRWLFRALQAIDSGDVEMRAKALNHVLEVIAELQSSLDFARGGKVAPTLNRFYELARRQIMEAGMKQSKKLLNEMADQFTELREAWEQAAQVR